MRFVPDLAIAWTIDDERIHTFRFRERVRFHNGDALTAEAVKWSLERVMNPEEKSFLDWKLAAVEKLDVLDPYTLRMTLKHPDPFMSVALTGSTGRAGSIVNRCAVGYSSATTLIMNRLKFSGQKFSKCPDMIR